MAIQYANNNNFESLIQEGFVIVDFFSATCVPCKVFSRVLEELEAEIPFVDIVKVNTTDYPEIGQKNNIQAFPTIQFYKDGNVKYQHVGVMNVEKVKEQIAKLMY